MLDYGSAYSPTGTSEIDPSYPGGKAVNASSLTAKDGFPALANRSNDLLGILQWVIKTASRGSITNRSQFISSISGSPDNADISDFGNALLSLIDPIDPAVLTYSDSTDYAINNLVKLYGRQYLCLVANGPGGTIKNPIEDVNGDYWLELPGEKWCRQMAQVNIPFFTGDKNVFNYLHGSYRMNFPFGQYKIGNNVFKYFMVLHDSSNVISVGHFAHPAMQQGTKGATIATLVGSDYTMKDGKDCAISARGPQRPATFGRQEDQVQGHWQEQWFRTFNVQSGIAGAVDATGGTANTKNTDDRVRASISDGVNGTPRIGPETRMKNLQAGSLAQIVCEIQTI